MNIKKIRAALALAMSITASAFVGVMAEEDVVSVSVDNTMVAFDQNPVIIDGYTLVPVRAVFEQAGAKVVGCSCAIEKGFQQGGDNLRAKGIRVESLAIVESMDDTALTFRKQ